MFFKSKSSAKEKSVSKKCINCKHFLHKGKGKVICENVNSPKFNILLKVKKFEICSFYSDNLKKNNYYEERDKCFNLQQK